MKIRIGGPQAAAGAILGQARVNIAALGESGSEPGVSVGITGIELDGVVKLFDGFGKLAGLLHRTGKCDANVRVARSERKGTIVLLACLRELTSRDQRVSESRVSAGARSLKPDLGPIFVDRLRKLALRLV